MKIFSVSFHTTKWRQTNASKPTLLNKRRCRIQKHAIILTPLSIQFGLSWVNVVNSFAKKDKRQRFQSLAPSLRQPSHDLGSHHSPSPITSSRKGLTMELTAPPALQVPVVAAAMVAVVAAAAAVATTLWLVEELKATTPSTLQHHILISNSNRIWIPAAKSTDPTPLLNTATTMKFIQRILLPMSRRRHRQ